jgi:hypothetical protein
MKYYHEGWPRKWVVCIELDRFRIVSEDFINVQ